MTVVSPALRMGRSKFCFAAAAASGIVDASLGADIVIAEIEPSGSDAVLFSRLRLIFAFLRKSAPRMQADDKFWITKAGKENDEPSGNLMRNAKRPNECRVDPWTSVRLL